jgi:hypothetical protein
MSNVVGPGSNVRKDAQEGANLPRKTGLLAEFSNE